MVAAKPFSSGTFNSINSEEGNDSLEAYFKKTVGKEPLLPFSRAVDSPAQWIQWLHTYDQPDLPGWPLLTPLKVQMQKCDKCSREFCSPINYRRHVRMHRRSLNVDKESHKNRDLLAAFWDKQSLEQAKGILSFDDVMLKEIPGSSVINSLATSLRKTGVWTLPQVYVKAGSTLLDIIHAKPSRLPISSQELFSILDEASERTFLCAGTAESLQKYVFDGETAKNGLDLKNLVATISFLFEQKLVKAWVADKDAEALRCHKLLVEEEEAAQKRQAVLLERKKQKKLRQKEQKLKQQFHGCNTNFAVNVDETDRPTSAEASEPSPPSDSNSYLPDTPTNLDSSLECLQPQRKESDEDMKAQFDSSSEHINQGSSQAIEPQTVIAAGHRHAASNCWLVSKLQRASSRYPSSNLQTSKHEPLHKLGPSKDRTLLNGNKVWTKKHKIVSVGDSLKPLSLLGETNNQSEESKCELIIGSIPVTLRSCVAQQLDTPPDEAHAIFSTEPLPKNKNVSEKLSKANTILSGTTRVTSKLWRPVSRGEAKSIPPVHRSNTDTEGGAILNNVHDQNLPSGRYGESQCMDGDDFHNRMSQQGSLRFNSAAARELLAERWKESISGEHVQLVLSAPPESPDVQPDSKVSDPANPNEARLPANVENEFQKSGPVKFSKKRDKGPKSKYIRKQKPIG